MTPLPGLAHHISLQLEAAAEFSGRDLTKQLHQQGRSIDKATGYLETFSPLFAGSAADPQRRLFTHDDPTA